MAMFKCKMCGGNLEVKDNESVAICEYCGTQQTLPKLDDDKRVNLYDRANHFRRHNEFDKAINIYESILSDDGTDAEAYWSLVLCRYGIEYVEDPTTHKRVPTVNRVQYTSIFDDADYQSALKYADEYQKEIYKQEATIINEIQKEILAISQKEEPFDVFICYKETDKEGKRTQDSVLANELYHQLTLEGFKVFFSRITLEDRIGTEYEPYIFAALNSAKVMVVLGTKAEYFQGVWVKNEWSRYLALIKNGAKKALIPAYRDMDPYDLPEEFSHLQAQDMSKLGFMQDLIRGIRKLTETSRTASDVKGTGDGGNVQIAPLLKRAFMFLEDGNFSRADEFCEQVLNQDPENAEAYLGKLMAELKVCNRDMLKQLENSFENNNNYQKVIRFAEPALKAELIDISNYIKYNKAIRTMEGATQEKDFILAIKQFEEISGYQDVDVKIKECHEKIEHVRKETIYISAKQFENIAEETSEDQFDVIIENINNAISTYEKISGYRDSDERVVELGKKAEEMKMAYERKKIADKEEKIARKIRDIKIIKISLLIVTILIAFGSVLRFVIIPSNDYKRAIEFRDAGDYEIALTIFEKLGDYKDSNEQRSQIWNRIKQEDMHKDIISAGYSHIIGLKSDGTLIATGRTGAGQCDVSEWKDIVSVSAGDEHTVGLKSDGTVVATGDNEYGQCNISEWKDIVSISAGGDHTVGLKSDGTVVAAGNNEYGQCDISEWKDIVSISAGGDHTVGLKSDGTVVATGDNERGQCNTSRWKNITSISAGRIHTAGLKSNGRVVVAGYSGKGYVSDWRDIVSISAGAFYTIGLKSDGTVVASGDNMRGVCNVSEWKNIVSISAGQLHAVGVKFDGTVVSSGSDSFSKCDVFGWNDIKWFKK